jgi:hypothetical protein
MDVKQAVSNARSHLLEVFSDELVSPPTLEEVWFDDDERQWCVTFGLKRTRAGAALGSLVLPFDFKVVRLGEQDGKPISIRDRSMARDQ